LHTGHGYDDGSGGEESDGEESGGDGSGGDGSGMVIMVGHVARRGHPFRYLIRR
jgi:hypothetical protein